MEAPVHTDGHRSVSAWKMPPGPDWDQVPFEVKCARCGADLRSLHEPKCPACSLEFDWADAVPLEELLCETCGYHLIGLSETRCPECGEGFTWEGALAARRRRKLPFFEYHWRGHPFQSFRASVVRALRPRKLWTQVDLHDRPPVKSLVGFAVLSFATAMLILLVGCAVVTWAWMTYPRFAWAPQSTIRDYGYVYTMLKRAARLQGGSVATWATATGLWCAASLGSLMIFRQSMRRYRVRSGHVVRVWCYATGALLPWAAIAIVIWTAIVGARAAIVFGRRWGSPWSTELTYVGSAVLASGLACFTVWSLRCAYRHYLGMDRAIWVAAASQVIAVLAMETVVQVYLARW